MRIYLHGLVSTVQSLHKFPSYQAEKSEDVLSVGNVSFYSSGAPEYRLSDQLIDL